MIEKPPFPGRPAQPPGPTFLQYSPDGKRLLVAGTGDYARSFRTGDDGEPDLLPRTHLETFAVASGNDYVILGCEDGTVCEYEVPSGDLKQLIVRTILPIRGLALSPDEKWIAVSSDELEIKIVNRRDIEQITVLKEHPKPIKHLTYEPSGKYLAASCTNGIIYIYDLTAPEPSLFRTIDGVVLPLETAQFATSSCVWHPDGRAFACATPLREIQVISVEDGAYQRKFTGQHGGDITAIEWSPNGALLASSDSDCLCIWETKTQQLLKRFNYAKIINLAWQNTNQNIFSWTTSGGEAFLIPNFLKDEAHVKLLKGPKVAAPFYHDPLLDKSSATNGRVPLVNGQKPPQRATTPDSLDELLGPEEEYDWIEDDDGAGYINENGKRTSDALGPSNGSVATKRNRAENVWQPQVHEPFQPGATPWRGNRKYLCLNLVGFVWTVDQDTHNTVTVEFYDREMYRDFHFTDPFLYDKACLNEKGALFSCPSQNGQPSVIFYRPHEVWTTRADSRITLADGEEATSIALGSSYIVAVTNKGYVRVWTLFGTPVRVWRVKNGPAVTCAAWGDYVWTVGNGPVGADGCTQLTYSIDNVRQNQTCQNEDVVSLTANEEGVSLKSVFWSDGGDPCIFDSDGVLLTLMHWRRPGQAKWVPLLDTRLLDRLKDGRKEETYWPVAVAAEKFHCIILKGGDKSPYFPRPLLTEFDFQVPVSRSVERNDEEEESNAAAAVRLEEAYVRSSVLLGLVDDVVQDLGENSSNTTKMEVMRRELEVDKILLQLLAVECREGDESGMKALEIVRLLRDKGGKMLEAAAKVAGRWGRGVLEEKIRELAERRLMGLDEE